ncbi:hypothetical protein R3P38DRAFT_2846113 [Favolaschia claudopus]|uniref:AB hydrolase-1 domain-containing protein n=1 Tax=Favolaschia claudopus TaxID=2862362 RepID=A0AAW0DTS4_9AGAR
MRFSTCFLSLLLVVPSLALPSPRAFKTIVVNSTTNVELSYIDSGAPAGAATYPTIFAIHGIIFSNLVFQKLMDSASSLGVRVVGINRRPFPGSTPFTDAELNVIYTGGSGTAERQAELDARGHELGTFIANFITQFNLPRLSADGKTGGAVLLGWSLGAPFALAAVSAAGSLPPATLETLSANLRSIIVYEPAPLAIGLPTPSQNWNPLVDSTIPADLQLEAFGQWVTAYFDNNIANRNLDDLAWVVTSPSHTPTLYTIAAAGKLDAMQELGADAQTDLPFIFNFASELLGSYRNALFDANTAATFPKLKRSVLCGTKTAAFGVNGFWAIQDDQAANAPQASIAYKMMDGTNHLAIWDNPTTIINTVKSLV